MPLLPYTIFANTISNKEPLINQESGKLVVERVKPLSNLSKSLHGEIWKGTVTPKNATRCECKINLKLLYD